MADCREAAISEEYGDFIANQIYIDNLNDSQCYQRISGYYGTIYTPLESVGELQLRKYPYNSIPALYGLCEEDVRTRQSDIEDAKDAAGITRLQNIPTLRLKGQGCIVAIVDTGINIEDESFRYSNGATRILRLWDMTDQNGTPPEGIGYGSEYTEEDINQLLSVGENAENNMDNRRLVYPGHDEYNHGNILARIAAGNNGAVPESYLIVVKLKEAKQYLRQYHGVRSDVPAYQENDIMLAVNYVKEIANRMDMPVSLCIALGTNSRGHDGNSALSYILDSFVSTGKAVASVSGGEQSNKQLHASDEENVELRVGDRQNNLNINIWGRAGNVVSVGLTSPTGEVIPPVPARINAIEERRLLLEGTKVTIEYDMAEGDTGDQFVLIRLQDATEGVWRISVNRGGPTSEARNASLEFDAYLPVKQFIYENTYFLKPDPDVTLTDPAYARKIISDVDYDVKTGALYIGQGRGFARNGGIKPDLTSPMSVALLTGAVTQLQQWGMISGIAVGNADIKSYLLRGAERSSENEYPNRQWGYGKLDVYNALEVLRMG